VDQLVAQRLAGGVQALEDLLRVGRHAEGDRDVLELLQAAPDPGASSACIWLRKNA
jgi:hypothetical protein